MDPEECNGCRGYIRESLQNSNHAYVQWSLKWHLNKMLNKSVQTQLKEKLKMFQDNRIEIEWLNKTETEIKLEIENLWWQTKPSEVRITSTLNDIEKRISGLEDKTEEMDSSIKTMLFLEIPSIKHLWNLGYDKSPNLQIIEIEEETQVRETESIVNIRYFS